MIYIKKLDKRLNLYLTRMQERQRTCNEFELESNKMPLRSKFYIIKAPCYACNISISGELTDLFL